MNPSTSTARPAPALSRLALPALAVGALAVGAALPGDRLALVPEAGRAVEKVYTMTSEMSLEEEVTLIRGNEMPVPQTEHAITSRIEVRVTDEVVALEGRRPRALKRTFETISSERRDEISNPIMGDRNDEVTYGSDLEGLTVLFERDEDGELVPSVEEDVELDADLLEGLAAEFELADLLPEDEVSEGDAWTIDPAAMRSLLAPFGELSMRTLDVDPEGPGAPTPRSSVDAGIDFGGEIRAAYRGLNDDGLAVVALTVEVDSSADLTEVLSSGVAVQGNAEVDLDIESIERDYVFEGAGELVWDLERGMLRSLSLQGDVTITTMTAMKISFGGQEQETENRRVMAGEERIEIRFE